MTKEHLADDDNEQSHLLRKDKKEEENTKHRIHHGHDDDDDDDDDVVTNHHGDSSSVSHHHDHHHGSGHQKHLSEKVPLYSAPRQRQRWNEQQVLPHVNWGDLYFDLFYVSAAYNLSHGFKADPTLEGFVWFLCCYLAVFQIWNEKLIYDARYSPEDNLFHRTLEVFHLCIVGTIVWFIQPSYIMNHLHDYTTTVAFTGFCTIDGIYHIYWYYDLLRNVVGGPEAKRNAHHELRRHCVSCSFYAIAFGVAAHEYFIAADRTSSGQHPPIESISSSSSYSNNWPAYIIIFGYMFENIVYNLTHTFVIVPKLGHFQTIYVPINLEYTTHRIGEWVMLMLGESILSILTGGSGGAQTEQSFSYSVSFYCGILTVTMLQYLFFRTQPSEGKDHAMRRSQIGGYLYFYFHTVYSASLILVGCSYKMMLSPDEMREELEERYGNDDGGDNNSSTDSNDVGEDTMPFDLNSRIALVYAVSQTVSFLASDAMLWTHRGARANIQRFFPPHGRFVFTPWLILGTNATLLTLTMCLCQVHDLTLLSLYGCLLVFGQVILRTFGSKYFPVSAEAMERALQNDYASIREDTRRWPNVTEPGN